MTAHPRDREGLEVIDLEECLKLLASEPVGRLAYVQQGQPQVVPVNHLVYEARVAFRTAAGGKLDAAIMGRSVAYEVDDYDPADRSGWSVVVRGEAGTVEDPDLLEWLEAQQLHPWAEGRERPTWVVIRADEISGRRIVRPQTA